MVDSFLFEKFPPGRRITVRRSSPAHLEYQITDTGKRQEKIGENPKRRSGPIRQTAGIMGISLGGILRRKPSYRSNVQDV
jgi:hypothetical protein